jgi:hypothetical protein
MSRWVSVPAPHQQLKGAQAGAQVGDALEGEQLGAWVAQQLQAALSAPPGQQQAPEGGGVPGCWGCWG